MGQQTILRVETGKSNPVISSDGVYPPTFTTNELPVYDTLDLYKNAPIKINKSYAEVQDISKKNSDYSVPINIPGSKKNNRFFETFYNVDSDTLYFDPTRRVNCQVLIDDVVYFKGYLKLNKVSLKDNKVEYNVTLFSELGDLFGKMGNGLLSDLNYTINNGWRPEYTLEDVSDPWNESPYREEDLQHRRPEKYMFPIVHNGYVYDDDGNVATGTTRLYSSTIVGAWNSPSAASSAGATNYNLNSPTNGLFINQLKPALSVYHLFEFIFDFYGYTIKSEFKETPWFKQLYMYGYFANEDVLAGYKYPKYQSFPLSDVEIIVQRITLPGIDRWYGTIVKKNTRVPCYCDETVEVTIRDLCTGVITDRTITIEPFSNPGFKSVGCTPFEPEIINSNIAISPYNDLDTNAGPSYYPAKPGTAITYYSGNTVNLNLMIDQEIKQIDFLSSVAKKFNLVFSPDPNEPNVIIMEPLPFFLGSGDIKDWSGKLSYDKGFTVEPAQNFIESEIILSDSSDKDGGNSEFERIHNRVYGEKKVYSKTDFRSRSKKIETIFSPEVIRKWDVISQSGQIDLPLGINYSESSSDGDNGSVTWTYEGLKSKPKLFYYVDNASPFLNSTGELFTDPAGGVETFQVKISEPGTSNQFSARYKKIPIISHTSPIGADDDEKINNDTLSILFESERSLNVGVQAFDAYSKFDLYTRFYENNINNLFDKNTRFLKGKFNLNLDDILNIKPNDLIKLKEQYFQWNKIKQYNLTEYELTEVELVQYNNVLQTYPTRYFNYHYLDNPSDVYRFKTDMTNEELSTTAWGRSVRYDYLQGANGLGNVAVVTGVRDPSQSSNTYVGQEWIEVTEEDYNTNGGIDREYDSLYVYSLSGAFGSSGSDLNNIFYPLITGRISGGTSYDWFNVFTDAADFNTKSTTFGFVTGSSTTHGVIATPTPTPVPTLIPPTPTPYYNIDGAMISTFNPVNGLTYKVDIYVDGDLQETINEPVEDGYSIPIQEGQDIKVIVYRLTQVNVLFDLIRRDFTNDNEGGDLGIKETTIVPSKTEFTDRVEYEWTIELPQENCNYEYRMDVSNLAVPVGACSSDYDFVMTVDTSINTGTNSGARRFELPLLFEGTYNFNVDWGDGNNDTITSFDPSPTAPQNHDYATDGVYTITIVGELLGWRFGGGRKDDHKVTSVLSWGCLEFSSIDTVFSPMAGAWESCINADFTSIADTPDLRRTPSLAGCFAACGVNLTTIDKLDEWDMYHVTDISTMFFSTAHNQDLNSWYTGNITNMAGCWQGTRLFNGNISDWDTSNVIYFTAMFDAGSSTPNIGVFTGDISQWNTSSGQFFVNMFRDQKSFDGDLSLWNMSSALRVDSMFEGCDLYDNNGNNSINNWDVSNVTRFTEMFAGTPFNRCIKDWDTNSAEYMDYMFNYAQIFNQNLSGWCTEAILDYTGFDANATGWTTPNSRPIFGTCPSGPIPTCVDQTVPTPTPSPTPTATSVGPTPTPTPTPTTPAGPAHGYMTNVSFCDGEFICDNAIDTQGPWIHLNTPFWSDETTCNPVWTTLSNCIDVGNYITYPVIQTEGWYGLTHIADSYVNIDPFVIFYIKTTGEITSTKQCQNGNVVGWPSDQPPFDDGDVTPTPIPGCQNPPIPTPTP